MLRSAVRRINPLTQTRNMSCHCGIVPPFLLEAIANSSENETHVRESAQHALTISHSYCQQRQLKLASLATPQARRARPQGIVPDDILTHISENAENSEQRAHAKRTLEHSQEVRSARAEGGQKPLQTVHSFWGSHAATPKTAFFRAVYDAKHSMSETKLPGKLVRSEGGKVVADKEANQAYDTAGVVLDFYKTVFNWNSVDNKGMHVISSVNFGTNYENAFWNGEQMVYGNGATFLYNFTKSIDVVGHEMTHGVTEHTCALDYLAQSGALNESISDVFGSMIKQYHEKTSAADSDWLIGEGCLLPDVKGVALRSMKAPGTAYDDPRFGKDPQPDNFSDYKVTTSDNGGVHLYSGIPNKAFYLASIGFGGFSWEKAGKVWWAAVNSGQVPPKSTFLQFADVTIEQAEQLFGDEGKKVLADAWVQVGVERKA